MIIETSYQDSLLKFDLTRGIDLSIPVRRDNTSVEAFYIPHAEMQAFKAGTFVGSVEEGGACNCENIRFNAHGNGTHTECYGHVSKSAHYLPDHLHTHFFLAQLISIDPVLQENGDRIIMPDQIPDFSEVKALAIRCLPNSEEKKFTKYSGTNPTYLHPETALKIREMGIEHLLIDQPSVDKEEDGGLLAAHKNYWNYPDNPRKGATITEFIFVPNEVKDGLYLLNLMVASMQSDAVPSKPMLYPLS